MTEEEALAAYQEQLAAHNLLAGGLEPKRIAIARMKAEFNLFEVEVAESQLRLHAAFAVLNKIRGIRP